MVKVENAVYKNFLARNSVHMEINYSFNNGPLFFKLRIQFYIIKEIHGGLDNCKSQVVGTDTKDTFKGFRIMHVFWFGLDSVSNF